MDYRTIITAKAIKRLSNLDITGYEVRVSTVSIDRDGGDHDLGTDNIGTVAFFDRNTNTVILDNGNKINLNDFSDYGISEKDRTVYLTDEVGEDAWLDSSTGRAEDAFGGDR